MSELTTDHRGYKIRFSENRDMWWCHELDLENASLSKLREAINKVILKASKASKAAPALYVGHDQKPTEVSITSYAGLTGHPKEDHVWTVRPDMTGGRQRNKEPVTRVMLDTPENRAWGAEYARLLDASRAAQKAAQDYRKTIPHVTLDQLVEAKVITGKIEGKDGEEAD